MDRFKTPSQDGRSTLNIHPTKRTTQKSASRTHARPIARRLSRSHHFLRRKHLHQPDHDRVGIAKEAPELLVPFHEHEQGMLGAAPVFRGSPLPYSEAYSWRKRSLCRNLKTRNDDTTVHGDIHCASKRLIAHTMRARSDRLPIERPRNVRDRDHSIAIQSDTRNRRSRASFKAHELCCWRSI